MIAAVVAATAVVAETAVVAATPAVVYVNNGFKVVKLNE